MKPSLKKFALIALGLSFASANVLAQDDSFVIDAANKASSLFDQRLELISKANGSEEASDLQLQIDEISSKLDKAIAHANEQIVIAANIYEERQMIAKSVDKINNLEATAAGN